MKRFFVLLCVLCALLSACGESSPKMQSPVTFYYLRNDITYGSTDSVICATEFESAGHEGNIPYLLTQYLAGPTVESLKNCFPVGTALLDYQTQGSYVILVLTDNFAQLAGIDLTVASACLTKTVLDLTGAKTVEIQARTQPLGDMGSIIMDEASILLLDDAVTHS